MKKITNYLVDLGLTEVEADIYQGLLQTGPTTVKELSEHLHMKRITTHFNVESLIEKGLIVQTMHGARRKIIAESPNQLKLILEEKEKKTILLKNNIHSVIENLNQLTENRKVKEKVDVKYYEGKNALQLIYDDVLKANEVRSYVNSKVVISLFPNNMNMFINAHHKNKNMMIWEIMYKSPVANKYALNMAKDRYFYKFIPDTLDLSVIDYLIYDGKVAIVNIKEHPSGLIIINNDYYLNAKAIYDFVWQMLPTVKD